jgi:hypothetical protein
VFVRNTSRMTDTRNLHVVVVTGAGASRALGADGQPVAMMPQWATDLVGRLGEAANVLGLSADMDGPAFEAAIGRFLTFTTALPRVAALGTLGDMTNLVGLGPRSEGGRFAPWQQTALSNQRSIQQALWQSLYLNFGRPRIDAERAYGSYHRLHEFIRTTYTANGLSPWISHATTNFDPAIEIAIDLEIQRDYPNNEKVDGFSKVSGGGQDLWAPNLFNAARPNHNGYIPVMHLHGAVGWYFDEARGIKRRPTDEELSPADTPALLLPDDHKDPASFPTPIFQIWEEFKTLLQNATHVLFVGHSLHDPHLLSAVQSSGLPIAAVSLTEPDSKGLYEISRSADAGGLKELLPEIVLIPGKFGQLEEWPDLDVLALQQWIERS